MELGLGDGLASVDAVPVGEGLGWEVGDSGGAVSAGADGDGDGDAEGSPVWAGTGVGDGETSRGAARSVSSEVVAAWFANDRCRKAAIWPRVTDAPGQ